MKAARITPEDIQDCKAANPQPPVVEKHCCSKDTTTPTPPIQHVGGPLTSKGSTNVKVNNLPAARTGDIGTCTPVSEPNLIVTGAATVKINGQLGARLTSILVHKPTATVVSKGSPNVQYGGATGGASFGDPRASAAATEACKKAAREGRGGEGNAQSKDMNCGMESVRQLCLQKCVEKKLPADDPACKCGNMSQDAWYHHYFEKHKDAHNEIAQQDYEKKKKEYDEAVEYNEKTWKKIQDYDQIYGSKTLPKEGGDDPKGKTWRFAEGQNVWCFGKGKSLSDDKYYIKRVPPKPMPPITDPAAQEKTGDVGSFTKTRGEMLKECGYEPAEGHNSTSGIGHDLANGNAVLAVVDVGQLPGGGQSGAHTITVTRMEYDEKGNLKQVVINDTSRPGKCGQPLTGAEFEKALLPNAGATNVVPSPVAPP
ncbi:MAG: PAAR domain-containing protein [Polyangiaceae bacterium]